MNNEIADVPDPSTLGATSDDVAAGHSGPANREARYRVERNEARSERDALAARVEAFQTREIERLAGKTLANPADLLALGGTTVADLLDDNGEVDLDKVHSAAAEVIATRPGLALRQAAFDPTQGLGGGKPKAEPTWGALLKP